MLRRPFSMHRLKRDNGILCLQFLHRVIGKGTEWLSSRNKGETDDSQRTTPTGNLRLAPCGAVNGQP
jgi:NAD(P)H-flavin reductase